MTGSWIMASQSSLHIGRVCLPLSPFPEVTVPVSAWGDPSPGRNPFHMTARRANEDLRLHGRATGMRKELFQV